jgi:hypothetical protein
MRARRAVGRFRFGCVSLLLAGLLAGCDGGASKGSGASAGTDPKGGTRRKEMENYMKNQASGATNKP